MKIKDLAAMVGKCRNIVLINTKDTQGNIVRQHVELNGRAIFPLDGMQPITPETLLTIADVEEEIRDKYTVTQINMNQLIVALDGMAHVATFTPHVEWADYDAADELHKVWMETRKMAEENERREQENR